MKMRKLYTWNGWQGKESMLIDAEDIKNVVDFTEGFTVKLEGVTEETAKAISARIEEHRKAEDIDFREAAEEVLETESGIDWSFCEDYEEAKENVWIIDPTTYADINALTWYDTLSLYTYWDGSNWIKKFVDTEIDSMELEYDEDEVEFTNLDEWDGQNMSCGGRFHHAEIAKIENVWFVKEWSQYQGDHVGGRVLETEEELQEYLQEINRSERFEELKNL